MLASRPTCALVGIYKSSKQTSNLAGVCSKRATLLSNVDRANRKSRCGSELTKGLDVKRQVFAPGGHDRDAAPEYFGFMGVAHGTLQRHHSGKGRAVPERSPSIPIRSFVSQSASFSVQNVDNFSANRPAGRLPNCVRSSVFG